MIDLSKEMMGAASVPLILSVLEEGESYGYLIIQRIKELSENQLEWKEGTLYPILHKMEKKKLITSFWKTSENGRKRKYYKLLESGKLVLSQEKLNWKSLNQLFINLWEPQINSI